MRVWGNMWKVWKYSYWAPNRCTDTDTHTPHHGNYSLQFGGNFCFFSGRTRHAHYWSSSLALGGQPTQYGKEWNGPAKQPPPPPPQHTKHYLGKKNNNQSKSVSGKSVLSVSRSPTGSHNHFYPKHTPTHARR